MNQNARMLVVLALLAGACSSPPTQSDADAGVACQPVLADQGRTAEGGFPLDGWNWQKQGPLPGMPEPSAAFDGAIGAALVEADGNLHLYFTLKTALQHRIFHATSADGRTWSAPEPVLGLAGDQVIAYPTVVYQAGTFWMWFTTGSIDLAKSADGRQFEMVSQGVIQSGETGRFDEWGVLYPSAVPSAEGFALWYTGYDGRTYSIGRATSTDGISWNRSSAAVLASSADGFDNTAVAQPCVVASGGRLRMWYGGYDTARTNPGPYRVGLAESADGISWTRRGVSVDLGSTGTDAYSTRDPAVIRFGGRWLMVYSGMGDDSRYRLHAATSDACE